MRAMALRGLGLLVNGGDPHASHERAHVLAADRDPLGTQEIAQHPAPGERQLEGELIEPSHEGEIRVVDGFRRVIHRGPRQPEELRLSRDGQLVVATDHRFPLGPRSRPSALDKKSNSSACWQILAWSAFTSIGGSCRSLAPARHQPVPGLRSLDLYPEQHR